MKLYLDEATLIGLMRIVTTKYEMEEAEALTRHSEAQENE